MTESQFQSTVIAMCKLLGVRWYHPYLSVRDAAGWPDLALCGPRGFMLRELKTERGQLTKRQREWGELLRAAGVSWDVWRPADLQSGRVQRELEEVRLCLSGQRASESSRRRSRPTSWRSPPRPTRRRARPGSGKGGGNGGTRRE